MTQPPALHEHARFDGRRWDEAVLGTPFAAPAGATTTRQVLIPPSTRVLVLGLSPTTNVTSVTVTGTGSGISYLTLGAAPAPALYPVQTLPQIDDHLTVSVAMGAGGSCTVYLDALADAAGLTSILGAVVGTAVSLVPDTATDASGTITTGGTAQGVFGGAPANGYEVVNPDASEVLWICDNGSAATPNGTGCIPLYANGGNYYTPDVMKPLPHDVSIYGATTGHKYTARRW